LQVGTSEVFIGQVRSGQWQKKYLYTITSPKRSDAFLYKTMHYDDLLFETADTHHYRYGLELHKQMLARLWDGWEGGRSRRRRREGKSSFT
jgi:hypothetical protein